MVITIAEKISACRPAETLRSLNVTEPPLHLILDMAPMLLGQWHVYERSGIWRTCRLMIQALQTMTPNTDLAHTTHIEGSVHPLLIKPAMSADSSPLPWRWEHAPKNVFPFDLFQHAMFEVFLHHKQLQSPIGHRLQLVPWWLSMEKGAPPAWLSDPFGNPQAMLYHSLLSPLYKIPARSRTPRIRRVMTLFDCIPLTHPQWTTAISKRRLNLTAKRIRPEDIVMVTSESVKETVLTHYSHIDTKQIQVIPLAIDPVFTAPPGDMAAVQTQWKALKNALGMSDAPYFLCLGSIEPRKNLKTVIEAYCSLQKLKPYRAVQLVIVGQPGWQSNKLCQQWQLLSETIPLRFTQHLPDQAVRLLYQHTAGFLFPSLAEGFGLPPLEAMACDAPVIASDLAVLKETCTGGRVTWVPAQKTEAWEVALKDHLDTRLPDLPGALNHLQAYSLDALAHRLHNLYRYNL